MLNQLLLALALAAPAADDDKILVYVDSPKLTKEQKGNLERLKKDHSFNNPAICRINWNAFHNNIKNFKLDLAKSVTVSVVGAEATDHHDKDPGYVRGVYWDKVKNGYNGALRIRFLPDGDQLNGYVWKGRLIYNFCSIGGGLVAVNCYDQDFAPE